LVLLNQRNLQALEGVREVGIDGGRLKLRPPAAEEDVLGDRLAALRGVANDRAPAEERDVLIRLVEEPRRDVQVADLVALPDD
jgi:hypothetical protein